MIKLKDIVSKEIEQPVIYNEFGCLMVYYNLANKWDKILNCIDNKDVYDNDKHEYGKTNKDESHVTILYGLHLKSDIKVKVKKFVKENITKKIYLQLKNVSIFENDDFDVLKFDVESKQIKDLNFKMTKQFEYTSDYAFHPHSTIAYIKKGNAEKYINKINNIINLPIGIKTGKIVFTGNTNKDKLIFVMKND